MRRVLAAFVAATVAAVVLVSGATTAHAAYTPEGVCGSGYQRVTSHDLGGKATMFLMRNASINYECVVTIKTTKVGVPSSTEAWMLVEGQGWKSNKGDFKYYAGPIRRPVVGDCIKYAGGHDGTNWTSPWVGCSKWPTVTLRTTGAEATCTMSTRRSKFIWHRDAYTVCTLKDTGWWGGASLTHQVIGGGSSWNYVLSNNYGNGTAITRSRTFTAPNDARISHINMQVCTFYGCSEKWYRDTLYGTH